VVLCQRRSSPERGNLPTSFALRFKGQPPSTLGTNSHQGGGEMPHGGEEGRYQPGHLPGPALDTARHPQSTVVQPTVPQGKGGTGETRFQEVRATPLSIANEAGGTATTTQALWSEVLRRLAATVSEVSFRTWLAPARLRALDHDSATVEAPHALAQRWIERHLLEALGAELAAVAGRPPGSAQG